MQLLLAAGAYTGMDYLRLAKNASIAKKLFQKKLETAVFGAHIIYVISEKEHLSFLPDQAVRILTVANLDLIQERFAERMRGNLPAPVAAMLERKHGCFDNERYDIRVVSGEDDLDSICASVRSMANAL